MFDVDANDFCFLFELKVLHLSLSNVLISTFEILEFLNVTYCYPIVSNAYRIILIIPMTIASAEKLRDMIEHIDLDTIINDFTSRNIRMNCFI